MRHLQDCIKQAQVNARHAVKIIEWWRKSVNHDSLTSRTDEGLTACRALLQQALQIKQLADTQTNWSEQWKHNIRDKKLEIALQIDSVKKQVRAERAMREIAPSASLRAAIWGLGEQYPQLSVREVQEVHSRYADSGFQDRAMSMGQDIVDQDLREAVIGLFDEGTVGFYER